ncbi:phospholipase [Bacillus spongiae]|uniref:Phospholipase n=1 Tax=Bacillus spongiae TaxID=2683610 RepID=A0ABU8HCM1_9BACI
MRHRNSRIRRGFCFPGYRWCGPGCSGPDNPVNTVDAACMAHDLCYRRHGKSCKCDLEFMHRLERVIDRNSRKGRDALLMYRFMKLQTQFTCR